MIYQLQETDRATRQHPAMPSAVSLEHVRKRPWPVEALREGELEGVSITARPGVADIICWRGYPPADSWMNSDMAFFVLLAPSFASRPWAPKEWPSSILNQHSFATSARNAYAAK